MVYSRHSVQGEKKARANGGARVSCLAGGLQQGEIPGSSNHAGIRTGGDLVLEELHVHRGYP